MDAPLGDPPAESPDLQFFSEGAHLNAYAHIAAGAGPHPTVVLLHGFPGNERNLDIAQALRRAGWNVFFFSYRGAWGSGGEFSFGNALEDVAAVVATLGESEFATKYRVDPERIVLLGHSMGGAAALISAAEIDEVGCVASLAGANLGALADQVRSSPEAARDAAARFQAWGEGRVRGATGEGIIADLLTQPERWRTTTHAAELAEKPVLLIAGSRDPVTPPATHHDPLVAAIRARGGALLTERVLDDEHQFSQTRIALTRAVLGWLETSCAPHLGRK
jgi:pimeloyl-ACP methyl ester carboxylesterase